MNNVTFVPNATLQQATTEEQFAQIERDYADVLSAQQDSPEVPNTQQKSKTPESKPKQTIPLDQVIIISGGCILTGLLTGVILAKYNLV